MIKIETIKDGVVRIYSDNGSLIKNPSGEVHSEYVIKTPKILEGYTEVVENETK